MSTQKWLDEQPEMANMLDPNAADPNDEKKEMEWHQWRPPAGVWICPHRSPESDGSVRFSGDSEDSLWIVEDDMSRIIQSLGPDHHGDLAWALARSSALTYSSLMPIKTMGTKWQESNLPGGDAGHLTHPGSWLLKGYLIPKQEIEYDTKHLPLREDTVLTLLKKLGISQYDPLAVTALGQIGYPTLPYVDVSENGKSYSCEFKAWSAFTDACGCPPGGLYVGEGYITHGESSMGG